MTSKEALPFSGQPSSFDILILLLNGRIDNAVISICSQDSSVSLRKEGSLLYEEKDMDYNGQYINQLRFDLQDFHELPGAKVVGQEKINVGHITHVTIPWVLERELLKFAVTSAGISNKFNRLIIARE